ncbi:sialate O-acetylesterase [Marinoscillum pacificum]|uniref:sialate O-acetylesterase n=1 Tax=Marinoscillum pacificum TaxID=392723 RepID=UPI002157084D|nr:sialate O-acetylesterase [Marinoscillum pacificum]
MRNYIAILLLLGASVSNAQLKLPRLFADHMVLQRDQPIKVWGWSKPASSITVAFNGKSKKVKSDKQGYFESYLDAQRAGGPFVLTVSNKDTAIVVNDVLVGDVWVASGQSNMEWQLQWNVNNWEDEVKDSDYPEMRFFKVPNEYASSPQSDINGGSWMLANEENSPQFSAVAWFFAKKNHLEKEVPVGIVESHWGGTPAEAWTTIETLAKTPGYETIADTIINPNTPWSEIEKENEQKDARKWELMRDKEGAVATGAQFVDFDDSKWTVYDLPCNCKMTDLTWLRREVSLDPDTISSVELFVSNVVQEAFVFFNGELIWSKQWNEDTKPLVISPDLIRKGKNVITYRVANSWDNNVYFGRPDEMWLAVNGSKISLEGSWKYSNAIEPKIPMAIKMFQMPSFLYNAKIAPIAGYTVRGVIWYQGESNADKPQYYKELFSNMIKDWRREWGYEMPFLYVQLANFMQRQELPINSNWAQLREAQTQTLELPKTAMTVTIDIGNADDIHPRNKKDVGERLWLAAKKVSFGDEVVYSGPSFSSVARNGHDVIVKFDHLGGGLNSEGPVQGFALAGEDDVWYWAEAEIRNNEIVLSSDNVSDPVQVSYALGDNPEANLYNREGLPAVPFKAEIKPQ